MGYLIPSTYRLTYSSPEWLKFLSVGEKVKDSVDDRRRITEWLVDDPASPSGETH